MLKVAPHPRPRSLNGAEVFANGALEFSGVLGWDIAVHGSLEVTVEIWVC